MPALGYVDYTAALPKTKTLVCVTDQKRCDRIIYSGRLLSDITSTDLVVITVAKPDIPQDPQSMEYLFSVAQKNNAEMSVLFSNDVAKAIIKFIKENKVTNVLTGIPSKTDSITPKLWKKFTHISFFVVEEDGSLQEIKRPATAANEMMSSCTSY